MTKDFFRNVSKAEIHLHLEGAIPINAMWELVQKYPYDRSINSIQDLKQAFKFTDFPHFLKVWDWKNQFIREYDDFEFLAEKFAENLINQNIIYAEVFYSPTDFRQSKLKIGRITESIRKGLDKISKVKVNLIADLVRNNGPKLCSRIVDEVKELKELDLIGIGIGGAEHDFPPELFIESFEKARNFGFRLTVHAGEASGSKSIWNAIKILNAERIGHGTRAKDDLNLINYLIEKQIPLEMCPISNIKTKVVNNLAVHPIAEFLRKGLIVSVNTDDPMMFGNNLSDELWEISKIFALNNEEISKLILNPIKSCWLDSKEKSKYLALLEESISSESYLLEKLY